MPEGSGKILCWCRRAVYFVKFGTVGLVFGGDGSVCGVCCASQFWGVG